MIDQEPDRPHGREALHHAGVLDDLVEPRCGDHGEEDEDHGPEQPAHGTGAEALDREQAERVRAEIPDALYEAGRSQLSLRVPDAPAERFPAVVALADALLEALRQPEAAAA